MKKIFLMTVTSLLISSALLMVSASAEDASVTVTANVASGSVTLFNHGAGH